MSHVNEKQQHSDLAHIEELKREGYRVYQVHGQGMPLYAWMHSASGASQSHMRDRQPYRSTRAQAWDDCIAYVLGAVPSTPNKDWKDEK